jgi:toxin ParE1/3/4
MKPVVHLSVASREMASAAQWYDRRLPGLGERFLAAVEATERFVQRNPELGAPHRYNTRMRVVEGFPFLLIYREFADHIRVYAVADGRRRPGYWRRRLE